MGGVGLEPMKQIKKRAKRQTRGVECFCLYCTHYKKQRKKKGILTTFYYCCNNWRVCLN